MELFVIGANGCFQAAKTTIIPVNLNRAIAMSKFSPPIKLAVTVAGRNAKQEAMGAALIHWALRQAHVPFVTIEGEEQAEFDPETFNPVLLGDFGINIKTSQGRISD